MDGPRRVNIISVRQQASGDIARLGKRDTLITYGLEPGEVHTVTIPNDAPGDQDIESAVRDDVARRHPAHGSSFEV